jgi:hypothetical protein
MDKINTLDLKNIITLGKIFRNFIILGTDELRESQNFRFQFKNLSFLIIFYMKILIN